MDEIASGLAEKVAKTKWLVRSRANKQMNKHSRLKFNEFFLWGTCEMERWNNVMDGAIVSEIQLKWHQSIALESLYKLSFGSEDVGWNVGRKWTKNTEVTAIFFDVSADCQPICGPTLSRCKLASKCRGKRVLRAAEWSTRIFDAKWKSFAAFILRSWPQSNGRFIQPVAPHLTIGGIIRAFKSFQTLRSAQQPLHTYSRAGCLFDLHTQPQLNFMRHLHRI